MFFLGLIAVAFGALLVIKTNWFSDFFGPIPWFDRNLGFEGGSRFGYKIIGIGVIFLGFFLMFGLFDDIILWIFKR